MELQKFIGKHFGPFKITKISLSKEKTYLKKDKVHLEYADDETQDLPLEVLENVVSDLPINQSELREKRIKPIVEKILILLLESELPNQDIFYATNSKLKLSIEDSFGKANKLLWGKENYEINLMDVEKILQKKNGNNNIPK